MSGLQIERGLMLHGNPDPDPVDAQTVAQAQGGLSKSVAMIVEVVEQPAVWSLIEPAGERTARFTEILLIAQAGLLALH